MIRKYLVSALIASGLLIMPVVAFADEPTETPPDETTSPADEPVIEVPPVAVEPSDVEWVVRILTLVAAFATTSLAVKEFVEKSETKTLLTKFTFGYLKQGQPAWGAAVGLAAFAYAFVYFVTTGINYLSILPIPVANEGVTALGYAVLNAGIAAVGSYLSYDLLRRYAEPKA